MNNISFGLLEVNKIALAQAIVESLADEGNVLDFITELDANMADYDFTKKLALWAIEEIIRMNKKDEEYDEDFKNKIMELIQENKDE